MIIDLLFFSREFERLFARIYFDDTGDAASINSGFASDLCSIAVESFLTFCSG